MDGAWHLTWGLQKIDKIDVGNFGWPVYHLKLLDFKDNVSN